jgi:hypothetical protein
VVAGIVSTQVGGGCALELELRTLAAAGLSITSCSVRERHVKVRLWG